MATFTGEFRSLAQEFLLVVTCNCFQFFVQAQEAFFEIFEYGGMYLKTDHFKLGVPLETLAKYHMQLESVVLLEYLLCLNDNSWL